MDQGYKGNIWKSIGLPDFQTRRKFCITFRGKPEMSFREPFREEMLPRSFRVLPRAQENLVFGPRLEEYLRCALIIDLP